PANAGIRTPLGRAQRSTGSPAFPGMTKQNEGNMAKDAGKILSRLKDEEIDWVDLRFTDPKGKWQHLTMASVVIDEDMLTDGFMFDGSSIVGWKAINESDMIL